MILWRSKNRQTAPEALAVCIEGMVGNLGERNIRRCLDQGEDLHRMALDPCLAAVPALHPRFTGAGASPVPHQLDCCRWRHTEPSGSAPTTHAFIFDGSNDAKAKIRRKGFGSACSAANAWTAESTTQTGSAAKSTHGNDNEAPPAPASNGCSQPTKPEPKWAAPIQTTPKSHNYCDEVLGLLFNQYLNVAST